VGLDPGRARSLRRDGPGPPRRRRAVGSGRRRVVRGRCTLHGRRARAGGGRVTRLGHAPRPRERVSEIVATGFPDPGDIVDNDAFFARCRFPITRDRAALIAETRMVRRTWCGPTENTWTMARQAVRRALANGPVAADEIDLVVVSSCSTIPMVSYPD